MAEPGGDDVKREEEKEEEKVEGKDGAVEAIGKASCDIDYVAKFEHIFDHIPMEQRMEVFGGDMSLKGLAAQIKSGRFKKIVVLNGAGISVAAGIPDFRSKGSGLYDLLREKYGTDTPEAVFDMACFREDPRPFSETCLGMLPGKFQPTFAHHFLKELHNRGLLSKVFTQNIDTMEKLVGLPDDIMVHAHGNFSDCHCTDCGRQVKLQDWRDKVEKDEISCCNRIIGEDGERPTRCGGYVKPDIVLFGEALPSRFHEECIKSFNNVDCFLCMGSSLRVAPVDFLVAVPYGNFRLARVLINNEKVGTALQTGMRGNFHFDHPNNFRDLFLQGDCDVVLRQLADELGWTGDIEASMERQKSVDGWDLLVQSQANDTQLEMPPQEAFEEEEAETVEFMPVNGDGHEELATDKSVPSTTMSQKEIASLQKAYMAEVNKINAEKKSADKKRTHTEVSGNSLGKTGGGFEKWQKRKGLGACTKMVMKEGATAPCINEDAADSSIQIKQEIAACDRAHIPLKQPQNAEASIQKSSGLPPGWTLAKSRSTGVMYYWHAATRVSSFQRPTMELVQQGGKAPLIVPGEAKQDASSSSATSSNAGSSGHVQMELCDSAQGLVCRLEEVKEEPNKEEPKPKRLRGKTQIQSEPSSSVTKQEEGVSVTKQEWPGDSSETFVPPASVLVNKYRHNSRNRRSTEAGVSYTVSEQKGGGWRLELEVDGKKKTEFFWASDHMKSGMSFDASVEAALTAAKVTKKVWLNPDAKVDISFTQRGDIRPTARTRQFGIDLQALQRSAAVASQSKDSEVRPPERTMASGSQGKAIEVKIEQVKVEEGRGAASKVKIEEGKGEDPNERKKVLWKRNHKRSIHGVMFDPSSSAWMLRFMKKGERTRLFFRIDDYKVEGRSWAEAYEAAFEAAKEERAKKVAEGQMNDDPLKLQGHWKRIETRKKVGKNRRILFAGIKAPQSLCQGVSWHHREFLWEARSRTSFGRLAFTPENASPEEIERTRKLAIEWVTECRLKVGMPPPQAKKPDVLRKKYTKGAIADAASLKRERGAAASSSSSSSCVKRESGAGASRVTVRFKAGSVKKRPAGSAASKGKR